MATTKTLTLRNVPPDVLRRLRERARRNGRSMQAELLTIVGEATVDQQSLEAQLADCRRALRRPMKAAEIEQAIAEGRS
jgi:plasmid stability protein